MTGSKQNLSQELIALAGAADFKNADDFLTRMGIAKPDIGFVLYNSYAILVGHEVGDAANDAAALEELSNIQQKLTEWIRGALAVLEVEGVLADGYVVFLLKKRPSDQLRDEIRKIELNTEVCRKHVVWPYSDGVEDRGVKTMQFVTVLGLPESPRGITSLNSNFDLCDEAKFALEQYNELKSLKKVYEAIRSKENVAK